MSFNMYVPGIKADEFDEWQQMLKKQWVDSSCVTVVNLNMKNV